MATIAVAELVRLIVTNTDYLGAAVGLSGPTVPRTVLDSLSPRRCRTTICFCRSSLIALASTWWMANRRMGFYLRAKSGIPSARAFARRARQPHKLYASC